MCRREESMLIPVGHEKLRCVISRARSQRPGPCWFGACSLPPRDQSRNCAAAARGSARRVRWLANFVSRFRDQRSTCRHRSHRHGPHAARLDLVARVLGLGAKLGCARGWDGDPDRGVGASAYPHRLLQQRRERSGPVRPRRARQGGSLCSRDRSGADSSGPASRNQHRRAADGRRRGGDGVLRQRDQGLRNQIRVHRQ